MLIFIFLGIITSIFQVVGLREFTFSIAKNELSFIVAIGAWLFFGALGSLIGKQKKIVPDAYLPFFLSLIFIFSIASAHLAKTLLNIGYYEIVSLNFALAWGFFLIGTLSFFIGYCFARFTLIYLKECDHSDYNPSKFFIWEAIGFFIGGVIFTFIFSSYSNPFFFAFLPVFLILILKIKLNKRVLLALILLIIAIGSIFTFDPILKREFQGANILTKKGSPYGPIFITKIPGVESLYANGSLVATSADKSWDERYIHSSFSALSNAEKILLIGPYLPSLIEEVLKYKIKRLDCVDTNSFFKNYNQKILDKDTKVKINFITNDPRLYLKNTPVKYDCIIMNIPAPSNLAFNRYFSLQFFQIVKSKLNKNGVFSLYIPSKRDILSPKILNFNSCILNTLGKVFSELLFLPSDTMIIVATDETPLTPNSLVEGFTRFNVKTEYFTVHHLKDLLDPGRMHYLERMINKNIKVNTDFFPRGFLYYSLLEQAKFYPNLKVDAEKTGILSIVLFISLIVISIFLGYIKQTWRSLLNIGVIGFSSIGLTAIIFVLFQVYCGALFWKMGILIGLFMIGLSSGVYLVDSLIGRRLKPKNMFIYLYLAWCGLILSLLLAVKVFNVFIYGYSFLYIYSLLTGIFTGAVYPMVIHSVMDYGVKRENIAIFVYSSDLFGAFLGSFIVSILFIPFIGIKFSILILLVPFIILILTNK